MAAGRILNQNVILRRTYFSRCRLQCSDDSLQF